MRRTLAFAGLLLCLTSTHVHAEVVPGGIYEGAALWEGPPAQCPYGTGYCDHGVRLQVACDGKTLSAVYDYPQIEATCEAVARFAYGFARIDHSVWIEEDVSQGCVPGRITLVGGQQDGQLDFRWERASNGEEVTTGVVVQSAMIECPQVGAQP